MGKMDNTQLAFSNHSDFTSNRGSLQDSPSVAPAQAEVTNLTDVGGLRGAPQAQTDRAATPASGS